MTEADGTGLRQLLAACVDAGVERDVLVLRRSLLPRYPALPFRAARLRETLDLLLQADRARLFTLGNNDLVVAWRGGAADAVQASAQAAAHLFAGWRLPPAPDLTAHFSVPRDLERLERLIDDATAPQGGGADGEADDAVPLDVAALTGLEAQLARADLSRFARRSDICGIDADGRFLLRWERRTLSVGELTQAVAPGRSLRADAWLFRRLCRTLDRRMMALLAAPGELRDARAFALPLTVAGILSPEFLRLDAALPAALRGSVVLGIAAADMLADAAAFLLAREFAHARAYRLMLTGVQAGLLAALPLAGTGLDLLELEWSPALAGVAALPAPPASIVLCGVHRREALAWGRARGVPLFEGGLVARGLLAPSRSLALGVGAAAA